MLPNNPISTLIHQCICLKCYFNLLNCIISAEPCESVPGLNNVTGSAMAATAACAGPSGSGGGGGSPPVPTAAPATTAGHHSPYDLRRKSPPAYHEPGPSGTCSLPARKRPRTLVSRFTFIIHSMNCSY